MSTSTPVVKRSRKKFGYDNLAGLLFSLPAIVLLTLFVLVPFIAAFVFSLYNVNFASSHAPTWMGLEQYRRILIDPDTSPIFWHSLGNNLYFAAIVVPVQTGLAVALAIFLNQKLRGIGIFRTFFFMPVVFPMSLVVVIWSLFFQRDSLGMFNAALGAISGGLIQPIDWLGTQELALPSIAILSIWAGVGFQMVVVLAGLQEIPAELYEAAAIDKASKWQQFVHVTLPGLRNTLVFVVMITTIFSLRLFDQVYILTGGTGGPLDSTSTVMLQAVVAAFKSGNVGQGSAFTVIFVLIIIVLTLIQRALLRQEKEIK
jgi:multiple sugar transport system permease protein